jgi:hypothetical protein
MAGPRDVLKLAKDAGPQTVDLRFCDLPGLMQHFSIPVEEFTEEGSPTATVLRLVDPRVPGDPGVPWSPTAVRRTSTPS